MKQGTLNFDWRKKIIDTKFKKYTVDLYTPNGKIPTVVSGIWAISPKQAIFKAIRTIKGKGFTMRDSRAYPVKH